MLNEDVHADVSMQDLLLSRVDENIAQQVPRPVGRRFSIICRRKRIENHGP